MHQKLTVLIPLSVLGFIRKVVKREMRRRCKNALSTDWLPDEKAKTFPLREYYSDLGWKKKVKKAIKDTSVGLTKIQDIFNINYEDGGIISDARFKLVTNSPFSP